MKRRSLILVLPLALLTGLLLALSGTPIRADVPITESVGGITAPADVLCVNPGGTGGCYDSVQAAVDAADPGDEIRVATGVYTGVQGRLAPPGYGGPSIITQVVYISKTVTVRGGYNSGLTETNPVSYPTILDAQGLGRVLFIAGEISPTLENLRITEGDADGLGGYGGYDAGSGVVVYTATATISGCEVVSNADSTDFHRYGGGLFFWHSSAMLQGNTVQSNTANSGGGLYLYHGTNVLNGNTIQDNTASKGGGLYLNYSDITLTGNTVQGNTTPSGNGGGLYLNYSTAMLSHNTIQGNTAWGGGGLYLQHSDTTLTDNTVQGNIAQGSTAGGGGLYLSNSNAVLEGNVVVSNIAPRGGGLQIGGGGLLTLTNNLVAGNSSGIEGSGLWFDGMSGNPTSVSLLHTTIADNHGIGQGVYVGDYSTLAFTNTIIAGHSVGITVIDGSTATLDHTLWYANVSNTGGTGAITSTNAITGDPAFVGGGDYHITFGSVAIDAGINAGVTTDIDGDPRPMNTGHDIGADEAICIGFSQADYYVNEAGMTATITVTLGGVPGRTVEVGYVTSDGTATAGDDYTAVSGTLVFSSGVVSQAFEVPILDDLLDEDDETILLYLGPITNAIPCDGVEATLTIVDNDGLPVVRFSEAEYDVSEDAGMATITATLSVTSGQAVEVDYATADGTAVSGEDYFATGGTLIFDPGQRAQTFQVSIIDDEMGESDETVLLDLSNPVNANLGVPYTSTLTIIDDDPLTVQFSASDCDIDEDGSAATITVTLAGATMQTATVDYHTADGTATAGQDYLTATGTLTFPVDTLTKTFTVSITDDALDEYDETVTLALTNPVNADLGTPYTATLTILDDDPLPALHIADTSVVEGDAGAVEATFAVTLSAASGRPVSVTYATADLTATAPADYDAVSGTLAFAPGQTAQTLTVTVNGDLLDEADETFAVNLSDAVNATISDTQGLCTILDDDEAGVVVEPAALTIVEGGASDAYAVSLAIPPAGPVTVTLGYDAGQVTLSASSLTFTEADWDVAQAITVTAVDDSSMEGFHTVTVTHQATGDPAYAGLVISDVVVSVYDNDVAGVDANPLRLAATEGATDTVQMRLFTLPAAPVTVTLQPDDQLATTPAYLVFEPGDWNLWQTVVVTAVDDTEVEGPHTGRLPYAVDSDDPDYVGATGPTVVMDITDNDYGAYIDPTVVNVAEGGMTGEYHIALVTQPTAPVTVTLYPGDQVLVSASELVFDPADWYITKTATVMAVDDDTPEGPHADQVQHSTRSDDPNYDKAPVPTLNVNITDNDPGPFIYPTSLAVSEDGITDTYRVSLITQPTAQVFVSLEEAAGQLQLSESSLAFTPETWYIPQTVVVSATDDTDLEGPHTAVISHTVASVDPDYDGAPAAPVLVDIADDELPQYSAYLPVVMRNWAWPTLVDDAPDECPGYEVYAGWSYREDFDVANDNDWYIFDATAGTTYVIETGDLGPEADTIMQLWSGDCTELLAENDDIDPDPPINKASRITWTAAETGQLSVLLRSFNYLKYGPDTAYTLWILEQ